MRSYFLKFWSPGGHQAGLEAARDNRTSKSAVDEAPRRNSCFLMSCTRFPTSFFQALCRADSGRFAIAAVYNKSILINGLDVEL